MLETPITIVDIKAMITTSAPAYKNYLDNILTKAKRITASVGQTIEDVSFTIDEDGCILPFGE